MVIRNSIEGKIVKFEYKKAIRTHYHLNTNNPVYEETGILGIVEEKRDDERINVLWCNGESNSYLVHELTLASSAEIIKYIRQIKSKYGKYLNLLSYPLNNITKESLCYTKGN